MTTTLSRLSSGQTCLQISSTLTALSFRDLRSSIRIMVVKADAFVVECRVVTETVMPRKSSTRRISPLKSPRRSL